MSARTPESDEFAREIDRDWNKAMKTPKSVIALLLFAATFVIFAIGLLLYRWIVH